MKVIQIVSKKYFLYFLVPFALSIFIYTRYFTNIDFGDEYDNFVYSWLLKNGILPYRDIFSHQYPLLAFFGLPLEFLNHSKEIYRYFVGIITFSFFAFLYFYLKSFWRLSSVIFMLFASFAISFYGGFQFDDGSFWAIFTLLSFFLVIKKEGQLLNKQEQCLLGILIFFTIISSPLHLATYVALVIFHLWLSYQNRLDLKKSLLNLLIILPFAIVPLLIFLIYLTLTKSLESFLYDAVIFNSQTFYNRLYTPYVNFRLLDFYLHSSFDVVNHFVELFEREGTYLLNFLKSAKFLIWPFGISTSYFSYLQSILSVFYKNFFTFEIFVALFYLIGFTSLILKRKYSLAFFSLLFIFAIRLRIQTREHMAPYYLFSYWMLSLGLSAYVYDFLTKKKNVVNLILTLFSLSVVSLFVFKNWNDFEQIAFNRFPKQNENAVNFLKKRTDADEKVMVLGDFTASYHYDSERFPAGYFMHYFAWYDWSERLRARFLQDLENYNGYLVVSDKTWEKYLKRSEDSWTFPYLEYVSDNFDLVQTSGKDLVFKR